MFRAVCLSFDRIEVYGLWLFLRFSLFDVDAPRVFRAVRLFFDRAQVNGLWLFLSCFVYYIDEPGVFRAACLSFDRIKVYGLRLYLSFLFDFDAPRVFSAVRLSFDYHRLPLKRLQRTKSVAKRTRPTQARCMTKGGDTFEKHAQQTESVEKVYAVKIH